MRIQCYLIALAFTPLFLLIFLRLFLQPGVFNSILAVFHCHIPNDTSLIYGAFCETLPHKLSEKLRRKNYNISNKALVVREFVSFQFGIYQGVYSPKLFEVRDSFIFMYMRLRIELLVPCAQVFNEYLLGKQMKYLILDLEYGSFAFCYKVSVIVNWV